MWKIVLAILMSIIVLPVANAAEEDYVLGPGDAVHVTVYGHTDLTTDARISGSGTIAFPLIGEVELNGLTGRQAEAKIAKLLREGGFVRSPQVGLTVQEVQSQQVAVLGQVNKPGKYPIDRGQTVLDMIAMAGGVTADGDDSVVLVKSSKDSKDGPKEQVVDLNAMVQGGDTPQGIRVSAGDIIYVPRKEMFYIYGQVNRPGTYPLERGMTVMQAVSVAEGLTDKGTERGLRIHRKDEKGQTQALNAKLTDVLQPNDVVYVKESLF
jgi:polysaccharide export outer membrane protein